MRQHWATALLVPSHCPHALSFLLTPPNTARSRDFKSLFKRVSQVAELLESHPKWSFLEINPPRRKILLRIKTCSVYREKGASTPPLCPALPFNVNTQVVKDERTGCFGENPGPSLRDSPAVWLWESARSAGAHASGVNGSVHRRHLLKGSELVLPVLLISAEGE